MEVAYVVLKIDTVGLAVANNVTVTVIVTVGVPVAATVLLAVGV